MRDINFFLPYQEKPPKTRYDMLILFALFAIVSVAILFLEIEMNSKIKSIESEIMDKQLYLNSSDVKNKLEIVDEKTSRLEYLKKILINLDSLESILNVKGVIHIGLFNDINESVPENVYIKTLNISGDQVTINGFADSYDSVAQFQYQLKLNDKFESVEVPTISEDSFGNFLYSLSGKLKINIDALPENIDEKDINNNLNDSADEVKSESESEEK